MVAVAAVIAFVVFAALTWELHFYLLVRLGVRRTSPGGSPFLRVAAALTAGCVGATLVAAQFPEKASTIPPASSAKAAPAAPASGSRPGHSPSPLPRTRPSTPDALPVAPPVAAARPGPDRAATKPAPEQVRPSDATAAALAPVEDDPCGNLDGLERDQCSACKDHPLLPRLLCRERIRELFCEMNQGKDAVCPDDAGPFPQSPGY